MHVWNHNEIDEITNWKFKDNVINDVFDLYSKQDTLISKWT